MTSSSLLGNRKYSCLLSGKTQSASAARHARSDAVAQAHSGLQPSLLGLGRRGEAGSRKILPRLALLGVSFTGSAVFKVDSFSLVGALPAPVSLLSLRRSLPLHWLPADTSLSSAPWNLKIHPALLCQGWLPLVAYWPRSEAPPATAAPACIRSVGDTHSLPKQTWGMLTNLMG